MRKYIIVLIFCLCFYALSSGQNNTGKVLDAKPQGEVRDAGEIFGIPVPPDNYYFVKSVVSIFGNKWGNPPKAPQEVEDVVWEQLLLSFVAFKENITVSQEEIEQEIGKSISAAGVAFDWKKDKESYAKWLKEKIGITPELFENQFRHLIQLEKLRKQVLENIKPQVSDEEAHAKFLNERNSLSVELVEFEEEKSADEFYKKISQRPGAWERERKKRPQAFKRPGFVSIEFLVDLWKIPQDAANKMMLKNKDEFYPPRPIYKGYAVFKVLDKRQADETQFDSAKEGYIEKVAAAKKYQGFNEWIKRLKEDAKIKTYIKGGEK